MPKRPRGEEAVAGSSRDNNPIRNDKKETVPVPPLDPTRGTEWRDLCQSLHESSQADISRLRELYEEVMKVREETPKVDASPREMCEVLATFYLTERSAESTSPYFSGGTPSIPKVLAHNFKLLVLKGDARNLLKLCQSNREFRQLCNKEVDWEAVYKALGSAVGVNRIYVPKDFNYRGAVQRLAKLQEETEKYLEVHPSISASFYFRTASENFFNSLAPTLADMFTQPFRPLSILTNPFQRAVDGGYKYIYETMKLFLHSRRDLGRTWRDMGIVFVPWKAFGMFEDSVEDIIDVAWNAGAFYLYQRDANDNTRIYLEDALEVVEGMLVSDKRHLVREFMESVTLIETTDHFGDIELVLPQDMNSVIRTWRHFGSEAVRNFIDEELA